MTGDGRANEGHGRRLKREGRDQRKQLECVSATLHKQMVEALAPGHQKLSLQHVYPLRTVRVVVELQAPCDPKV